MPFIIPEDVSTTKRQPMTRTRALRLWEAHQGWCILCGTQIDGVRERWFIEHRRALENGGSNDDANLGPAHYSCKAEKDAADHSAAAKAKRAKAAHLGIDVSPYRGQIRGAGFRKAPPQRSASRSLVRKADR